MRRAAVFLLLAWVLAARAETRLEADGTRIRGERETANALAIVPWRERGVRPPPLGAEGLLRAPLAPIDRTVFENRLELHRQRRAIPVQTEEGETP